MGQSLKAECKDCGFNAQVFMAVALWTLSIIALDQLLKKLQVNLK
jgi:hypothetical protein